MRPSATVCIKTMHSPWNLIIVYQIVLVTQSTYITLTERRAAFHAHPIPATLFPLTDSATHALFLAKNLNSLGVSVILGIRITKVDFGLDCPLLYLPKTHHSQRKFRPPSKFVPVSPHTFWSQARITMCDRTSQSDPKSIQTPSAMASA